jgi:hypothetical protein
MSEEWEKIRKALEDPKYKWRTIEGVVKSTGLDATTVVSSISNYQDQVVKSTVPSTTGSELFTTRKHYREKSSAWEKIASSIKNKVE